MNAHAFALFSEMPSSKLAHMPEVVRSRLGRESFAAQVIQAYARRCAITNDPTLPGSTSVENGLLLRADLRRLFDFGYITVNPDSHQLLVSRRIRGDFPNGDHYDAPSGRPLAQVQPGFSGPHKPYLEWHAESVFMG